MDLRLLTDADQPLFGAKIEPAVSNRRGGNPAVAQIVLGQDFELGRIAQHDDKAILTQQDLKQDYYQGSSFDIGEVDASIRGLLLKAPKSVWSSGP